MWWLVKVSDQLEKYINLILWDQQLFRLSKAASVAWWVERSLRVWNFAVGLKNWHMLLPWLAFNIYGLEQGWLARWLCGVSCLSAAWYSVRVLSLDQIWQPLSYMVINRLETMFNPFTHCIHFVQSVPRNTTF